MTDKFKEMGRKAITALVCWWLVCLPVITSSQDDPNGQDRKARVKAWEWKVKAINRDNRDQVNEICRSIPREKAPAKVVVFTLSFDFEVPVNVLFESLTDMAKAAPLYYPVKVYHVKDSPIGPSKFGEGSVRAYQPVPFLKYYERIEKWEKDRRLEWRVISGAPVDNQYGVMTFESLGPDRSRMTQTVRFEISPPLVPIARYLVMRENVKAFIRAQTIINENPDYYLEAPDLLIPEDRDAASPGLNIERR